LGWEGQEEESWSKIKIFVADGKFGEVFSSPKEIVNN
jgi:hypothetical protein